MSMFYYARYLAAAGFVHEVFTKNVLLKQISFGVQTANDFQTTLCI